MKYCNTCKELKYENEFDKSSANNDGLKYKCRDCSRIYNRNYMNMKYKDKQFYEVHKIRVSLSRGNGLGIIKDFLGSSNKFFKDWMAYQRLNKTIIDEQSDHVLPIAHYSDKPDLCWWWVNIRPLSKIENREKSDKVDIPLFYEQLNKSIEFFGQYNFPNMQEMEEVNYNWCLRVNKHLVNQPMYQPVGYVRMAV